MPVVETLGIDFVGSAAGLQDAVMASQRALRALERDSYARSFTLGRVMRTIVTPITSVILGAFAAKRALTDFMQGSLPGASVLRRTLAFMRLDMLHLSEAVGEFLAPMAQKTAEIISAIARRLEPLIRKITAVMPSIGAFFRTLGANALAALRPLLPTVFGFFDGLVARFKGMDWDALFERIRAAWNKAWAAIIQFLGPIIVRIASLIETAIRVIRVALVNLGNWFRDMLQTLMDHFGLTVPGMLKSLASAIGTIQAAIVVALAAIEAGIANLPLLLKTVGAAIGVALDFIGQNWFALGEYIVDVMTVAARNVATLFSNAFGELLPVIKVVGKNIGLVLSEVMRAVFASLGPVWMRLGATLGAQIMEGIGRALELSRGALLSPQLREMGRSLREAAGRLTPDVLAQQFPLKPPQFNFGGLPFAKVPNVDLAKIVAGLQSLPRLPNFRPADTEKLNELLAQIRDILGDDIAKKVADAFKQGPAIAAQIIANLPAIGGAPGARLQPREAIGALLFGTAEASLRESNLASKNPLVPLAQQNNMLTAEQLVHMRAAAKAAARKARLANF